MRGETRLNKKTNSWLNLIFSVLQLLGFQNLHRQSVVSVLKPFLLFVMSQRAPLPLAIQWQHLLPDVFSPSDPVSVTAFFCLLVITWKINLKHQFLFETLNKDNYYNKYSVFIYYRDFLYLIFEMCSLEVSFAFSPPAGWGNSLLLVSCWTWSVSAEGQRLLRTTPLFFWRWCFPFLYKLSIFKLYSTLCN